MIILTESQRKYAGQAARRLQALADRDPVEEAELAEVINFLNEIYWSGAER